MTTAEIDLLSLKVVECNADLRMLRLNTLLVVVPTIRPTCIKIMVTITTILNTRHTTTTVLVDSMPHNNQSSEMSMLSEIHVCRILELTNHNKASRRTFNATVHDERKIHRTTQTNSLLFMIPMDLGGVGTYHEQGLRGTGMEGSKG